MIRLNERNLNNIPNWDKQWAGLLQGRFKDKKFRVSEAESRFNFFDLSIKNGDKVLDIASGLSDFLPLIQKKKKIEAYGLDFSSFAIEEMRKLFPEINWVEGDALDTPFKDRFFDVVVAGETIEHFENPDLLIREIVRITKVGGTIVLSTPHIKGYEYHLWVFDDNDVRKLLEPYGEVEVKRVPTHYIVASCKVR